AWAWLPLGANESFAVPTGRDAAGAELGIRFALSAAVAGVHGFRRSHQQALAAQAVAVAAGPSGPRLISFAEVAPLALMVSSTELLRAWVHETLGSLADDGDHHSEVHD